jgi:hypothetical protein
MMKGGVQSNIQTRHQCITCMKVIMAFINLFFVPSPHFFAKFVRLKKRIVQAIT